MRSVWLQTHWDKFDNLLTDTFPEYFRFNQLITQWFQPHIHAPSVGHGLFFDQVPGLGNLFCPSVIDIAVNRRSKLTH
jgi:hypothetical protein